ncbi:MAG: Unknown protein [uncultured Sulfurovum sp.]|uniref:TIR domain-containing protein n=1 Tax=uncultured Sulfurovum sp. TaxID=269237 RepID=A0A6S6SZ41_9BACT|nr:MAG: Unknown protein [uncultured Sulfurovum sp.]
MYLAKYEVNNSLQIKQCVLKIKVLDETKNIKLYNFCLNNILDIDKELYLNISMRVSIVNTKMEFVLFFTSKKDFLFVEALKEKIIDIFTERECLVFIAKNQQVFDSIIALDNQSLTYRLDNASYYTSNKQIGVDFTLGSFIENLIAVSLKRKLNFSYQFQLTPYSRIEKKELERYARKYMLSLEDEVYMPSKLHEKLYSVVNNLSNMDYFIDEIFTFTKEGEEFYENFLLDEFALKLTQFGFEELPLESDDLAEDLMYTGLSRILIDDVTVIDKIFSSIREESLKSFSFKEKEITIKEYQDNDYSKQYDVFISYSTVNTIEAEKVCFELENEGYKCWYAPRDILASQQYPAEIMKGIKASTYFILLHSKNSTVSKYVVREVTKALSLEKIIIPILLDTAPLSENMEFILETCQWIDASQNNFDAKLYDLKDVLNKLK